MINDHICRQRYLQLEALNTFKAVEKIASAFFF